MSGDQQWHPPQSRWPFNFVGAVIIVGDASLAIATMPFTGKQWYCVGDPRKSWIKCGPFATTAEEAMTIYMSLKSRSDERPTV